MQTLSIASQIESYVGTQNQSLLNGGFFARLRAKEERTMRKKGKPTPPQRPGFGDVYVAHEPVRYTPDDVKRLGFDPEATRAIAREIFGRP